MEEDAGPLSVGKVVAEDAAISLVHGMVPSRLVADTGVAGWIVEDSAILLVHSVRLARSVLANVKTEGLVGGAEVFPLHPVP